MTNLLIRKAACALLLMLIPALAIANVGKRIGALDNEAWKKSVWLSAKDAKVVTETITTKSRSADGANYFASILKNEKKVVSAKWMTTGLGV